MIALQEQVSCTMEELAAIAQSQPLHVQRWLRQIAVATARCTKSYCVEYIASHQDGMGDSILNKPAAAAANGCQEACIWP